MPASAQPPLLMHSSSAEQQQQQQQQATEEAQLMQFLDHQREGLEHLVSVVSKDMRDVGLIRRALAPSGLR